VRNADSQVGREAENSGQGGRHGWGVLADRWVGGGNGREVHAQRSAKKCYVASGVARREKEQVVSGKRGERRETRSRQYSGSRHAVRNERVAAVIQNEPAATASRVAAGSRCGSVNSF